MLLVFSVWLSMDFSDSSGGIWLLKICCSVLVLVRLLFGELVVCSLISLILVGCKFVVFR